MNSVMYQTRMLNREIKHSNEYNQYLRTLQRLREKPKLYARTKEFQKRSMVLQCTADYNTLDEVGRLRSEYQDILNNPLVSDFLGAEQRVMGMLRRIEDALFDGVDLAVDILDDWE